MICSKKIQLWVFAIVSGCLLMSFNAITIIIPLRMADQGLSYSSIGGGLASFSLGMVIIKVITGRHSDLVGQKRYLMISLVSGAIIIFLMAFVTPIAYYFVLLCCLGVCRGVFTSINSSYTVELTEFEDRGKGFGNILGVSSIIISLGGIATGLLYQFSKGKYAFIIIAAILLVAALVTLFFLPSVQNRNNKFIDKNLFSGMNKKIYLFCMAMFLQTFVSSPMWNVIVPMHFYITFGYTAVSLGFVMSLDEFIGSPTYIIAGHIADKVNVKKMACFSYFSASLISIFMTIVNNSFGFLVIFLLCSIFVTCTYIAVPKAESLYIRDEAKGFEFALISLSASIGDVLGNIFLGNIIDKFTIKAGPICFSIIYIVIAVLLFGGLGVIDYKNRIIVQQEKHYE